MALSADDVAARVSSFPERYGDRLPDKTLWFLTSYANGGEWLMALESLLGALHRSPFLVSTREREELTQILDRFRQALPAGRLQELTTWLGEAKLVQSLDDETAIELARTIPERYEDRLPERTREWMRETRDSQEWADLAETLVDLLHRDRTPISSEEQAELWLILDALDLPRQKLRELPVA